MDRDRKYPRDDDQARGRWAEQERRYGDPWAYGDEEREYAGGSGRGQPGRRGGEGRGGDYSRDQMGGAYRGGSYGGPGAGGGYERTAAGRAGDYGRTRRDEYDERFRRSQSDFGQRGFGQGYAGGGWEGRNYVEGLAGSSPDREYGASGYGESRYGSSGYGRGTPGQYGESRYGRDAYSEGGYGQSGYGQMGYGEETGRRTSWSEAQGGMHRGRGPQGYQRSDERIREDISDRLTDDDALDASGIEVKVTQCEVTLDGTVNSRQCKRRAEDLAESVSGVRHVQNNLRVSQSSVTSGGQTTGTGYSSQQGQYGQSGQATGGQASLAGQAGQSGQSAQSGQSGQPNQSGGSTRSARTS